MMDIGKDLQDAYKRGRLDVLNELEAYIREMGTYDTADTPQTEVYDYKGDGKWERSE